MANLDKLGNNETGATAKVKINKSFDKADANETALASKVDKVTGKGLSKNDYTDAEKTKLAGMEGSHFKGVHASLSALETAHPASGCEAGSYAYIKATGVDEKLAILDNGAWAEVSAGGTPLTAAQIKTLYESNADTFCFDTVEKGKVDSALQTHQDITGKVDKVAGKGLSKNDYGDADKAKVALIAGSTGINFDEIILDGDRATNADIDDPNAAPATLLRFVPIAGLRHAITAFGNMVRETYSLKGNAPKMKMEVDSPSGVGAEMEVKYGATQVASMQWNKINQEFVFNLSDKDTGASKAQFAIKPDGKAYVSDKEVVTTDFYSYDFVKIPNEITVADTTWEDIMSLNTPLRVAGVYQISWEVLFGLNVVNKSSKFRYSIDDGATWEKIMVEQKDKTNSESLNLFFPYEIATAKEFKIKVQAAKEDAANVMKVKYGSIIVERKK